MKIRSALSREGKSIRYIIVNHKKELVVGILVLMFSVAVAVATVYNYMHMQSTIGVEPPPCLFYTIFSNFFYKSGK